MDNIAQIPFTSKAVEPVECIKAGWALIKDQYWLFVGMTIVGTLIAGAIPLGILLGPMWCGLYFALFQKRRGHQVEFGNLFKGFEMFGQSVIASLCHVVPIMLIIIPAYIGFYVGFFVTVATMGNDSSGLPMILFMLLVGLFWLLVIGLIIVISIGFTFAFPLIVDRGLGGFDAVKLSFKAAFANFWRLFGLSLLCGLLGFAGVLLCYFGMFLVFPISFAAISIAYDQVFGLSQGGMTPNMPPPPPSFN
jgi:hypothetical protein